MESPYPTERSMAAENPSIHNSNPPQLEDVPNAPTFQVREDIPWPYTEPAPINLFEARAGWLILPTPAPTKTEVPPMQWFCPNKLEKMYMGTTLPHLHKGRGRQ